MTEQFEKAKASSRAVSLSKCIDMRTYYDEKCHAVMKEAEAFRDMVHQAGEKATGQTVDKILFSWEEA